MCESFQLKSKIEVISGKDHKGCDDVFVRYCGKDLPDVIYVRVPLL